MIFYLSLILRISVFLGLTLFPISPGIFILFFFCFLFSTLFDAYIKYKMYTFVLIVYRIYGLFIAILYTLWVSHIPYQIRIVFRPVELTHLNSEKSTKNETETTAQELYISDISKRHEVKWTRRKRRSKH